MSFCLNISKLLSFVLGTIKWLPTPRNNGKKRLPVTPSASTSSGNVGQLWEVAKGSHFWVFHSSRNIKDANIYSKASNSEFCYVMGMSLACTMRSTFWHLTIINLIGKLFCDLSVGLFVFWLFYQVYSFIYRYLKLWNKSLCKPNFK